MSLHNEVPTIIHSAADADFSKYTYFQVLATVNTDAVINGAYVYMNAGLLITILVKSISGNDVYVLGSPINTTTGVSYAGTEDMPQLGGSAFLEGNDSYYLINEGNDINVGKEVGKEPPIPPPTKI